jgi:hypothetical protein
VLPLEGRTTWILARLESELEDPEPLKAMIAGAPLVDELSAGAELEFDIVMDAYDRAFALVDQLQELARAATVAPFRFSPGLTVNDDLVHAYSGDEWPSVTLLRAADPAAFARARELLDPYLDDQAAERELVESMCERIPFDDDYQSDAQFVETEIAPAVARIQQKQQAAAQQRAASEKYESERAAWIEKSGSPRLRLAAARGYKHDGIYRDERLERELPGFVALPLKGLSVGEVINPTGAALVAESEVLRWVDDLKMPDVEVRLAWVRTGYSSDHVDGEYVEVKNFLGRHTVYRLVEGGAVAESDDIPF